MITLDQAKRLYSGQTVYVSDRKNADGSPMRLKINGAVKTWKTRPNQIQIPYKHGLYDYGYLDASDLSRICLTEDEARG